MPNFFSVNSAPVNDKASAPALGDFEGGLVIEFEQAVKNYSAAATVIEIEQTVDFKGTAEGEVIAFEQAVKGFADSQVVIEFEQTVKSLSDVGTCFVSDWDLLLTINGAVIPKNQIIGRMEVLRSESDAALLTFELRPPVGIQDPCEYQGKRVTLDVIQGTETTRIYTGIVDYPTYSLVGETVQYRCTDKRRELINSQLKTAVKSIGYYTKSIFGEPVDTADELDKRLTTVPLSVDFDAYGNYTVTNIAPKSTADYVISSSDVFRRNPRVEIASRARLVNKFTFNMEYRYSRLHARSATFFWQHPAKDNICLFLEDRYSLTSKEMVRSAAQSAGWPLVGDIDFEEVWPGGWYNCGENLVGWSPIITSGGNMVQETDNNGDPITGPTGSPNYRLQGRSVQNTGSLFCLGAFWKAGKRWAQTKSEIYTATVEAPQSISKFGIIEQERNYGVESEYDDDEFENIGQWDERFGKLEPYKTTISEGYYIDYSDNRGEFNESFLTAVNIGKTTILRSHRDNRIIVEVPLSPEYDLKHTIEVATNKVDGRGKVSQIRHVFDISNKEAYSEVELSLSRAPGSASNTPISIPGVPNIPTSTIGTVFLGNFFGLDPNLYNSENWTGMIGNKIAGEYLGGGVTNTYVTTFPEAFVVRTPDIPDNLRENIAGNSSINYTVSIPNDPFEIAFVGDCG